jgi:hypothetical protein
VVVRETRTAFDPGWGELLDLDLHESGEWVGLFRDGQELLVRTPSASFTAPDGVRFPLIRCAEPGKYVLVDTRTRPGRQNGWILSAGGARNVDFFAGDGIRDVLANADTIVVTYFDEGVFGNIAPGHEGIAIFDGHGRMRAGYQSTLGSSAVDIADCYAACWEGDSRIAFFPYTAFPFVTLDVKTLEQEVEATPQTVHGASAVAVTDEGVLFHGPYDKKSSIYAWAPGREALPVGQYPGRLRGLRGGRFLTHGGNGFTIVERARTG